MTEDRQRRRVEGAPSGGAVIGGEEPAWASAAYQQWEDALEKLKALNYEIEFCQPKNLQPFTRDFFTTPGENAGLQFRSFQEITAWLISIATGGNDMFKIDKYDDPNTSVSKIMLVLKSLSFGLDFPAAKLKTPHGDAVCSVLDFLTDRALAAKKFTFRRPVYVAEDIVEDAEVDEDATSGEVDDEVEAVPEEEVGFGDTSKNDTDEMFSTSHAMLEAKVDPVEWKKELERVGPKLKLAQQVVGKEWRGHMELTKKHEVTIQAGMPDASSQLGVISSEVAETLEKLRTNERYINTQSEPQRLEYSKLNEQLKEVTKLHTTCSASVEDLTSKLAALTEELDEVKDHMSDRGSKMSEASPLVTIKQSMQQIKAEIKTFDLRIGVISHNLLSTAARLSKAEKEKVKRGQKQSNTVDDIDMDGSIDGEVY